MKLCKTLAAILLAAGLGACASGVAPPPHVNIQHPSVWGGDPSDPIRWKEIEQTLAICGGPTLDTLHPFSLKILDNWTRGLVSDEDFIRTFHWPNSEYLGVSDCLVGMLRGPII